MENKDQTVDGKAADHSETVEPAEKTTGSGQSPTRVYAKMPSATWVVFWVVMIAATVFLHVAAEQIEERIPFIDQAIRNILTFLAILGIPFTFFLWFSFFSSNGTRALRQSVFWGYILFEIALIIFLVQFVEFDGDLYPTGLRNKAVIEINVVDAKVDLKTETPDDYPQFLGPNRDGRLPNKYFAYDWDIEKPKLVWKQRIGQGHSGFSTRNGFAVTMEQRGEQELTTCYDIASGDLLWTYGIETRHETIFGKAGPRSTPTIFDGMVYSLGAHGHLACLNGSDGKPVWTKDLLTEFGTSIEQEANAVKWGRSASPLVFDDKVVVPAGGPPGGPYVSLVCYNRKTGDEIWRSGKTQIGYSSPTLINFFLPNQGFAPTIVSVNESNVTAHIIETGEIIWTTDRPGDSTAAANTSQPAGLPGGLVLLTKGYGLGAELIQFQGNELKTNWKNTAVLKTKFTNVVCGDGFAFALSDGRLECVDVANGKRVWKSRESYGHGQIILCGSELLVLSEKGYVSLVRAWGTRVRDGNNKHVQFTNFKALEGTSWNTIAVHGNMLLVRNSDEAACYEMPIRFKRQNAGNNPRQGGGPR